MIRARIQHHPSRAHLLPRLVESLGDLPVEVIEHESQPPSPWAGYKACMAKLPRTSHTLILQDDVELALNFGPAIRQIADTHRDYPVCLFIARYPRDTSPRVAAAMKMGRRYVRLSRRCFLPVVGVLWPTHKLREFDEWTTENPYMPGTREPRSDDAMGGRWKMATNQIVFATVPSLVEHPDRVASTIGKTAMWGKDRTRTAEFFAGDAGIYDWSMP